MSTFFPTDPKKIRERIKRYERAFNEPHHDDGAGKRFLLGQLYMLTGDVEGALKSYSWYKKTFPDDITEAFNHFCWTLALLRSGDLKAVKAKLRELVFDNLYVIPIFLGETHSRHDMWHGSNWSEPTYILEGPMDALFALWNESERTWIRNEWASDDLRADISKYLELQKKILKTSGPDARGKIMKEANRVAQGTHLRVVE